MMALTMVLGFTQCKKDQIEPQNQDEQVRITLEVENGGKATDGTRVNVNDNHVTFEKGDKILVGYNGVYVGTLTHNGTRFEGNIDATQVGDQRLYFYFVGNKQETLAVGDESCTVNISDQTNELPVLSFSESYENFTGSGSYSANLHNQCALVKFTLDNPAGSILVGNMHTEATINFSNPSIAPTGTTGSVRLYSKADKEKWAILLPQTAVDDAPVIIGEQNLTVDVPEITAGAYVTSISTIENDASSLVNLSTLNTAYTAKDGDILTGTLDGANNADQRKKISIDAGATITLRDAHIIGYLTDNNSCQWAGLNCEGDATIILEDGTTNIVQGSHYAYPGIHIKNGYTLTINANGAGTGTLDARCISTGAGGAGIGAIDHANSINNDPCGNIVINGGVITATGARGSSGSNPVPGGAGIGGAPNTSCGTITINGGNVTAEGGLYCAGIGTSSGALDNGYSSCGAIEINGGTVTATGGASAAGIGAGYNKRRYTNCNCYSVTITGGTVTATSVQYGAGIGSGSVTGSYNDIISSCGDISITGGTVTATGGGNAAGIGTGYRNGRAVSQCGSITIGAGVTSVTAEKGSGATNSIGAGKGGTCGTVTIGGVVGAISDSPYTYPQP